ncbi:MAG: TPR repeat protein [Urechidicola sp.]|jgi:TPR repeat protein
MSTLSESILTAPQRNPLFWTGLVVGGLILFIFFGSDRNSSERVVDQKVSEIEQAATLLENNGAIDRNLTIPPGMGARKIIETIRKKGRPYPLIEIFNQAKTFQEDGSLADAHLLYFFTAREGHLESIMQMALMSDPTQFRAGNSLLDQADAVQAYKWYQKAALVGYQPAIDSVQNLRQWALDEAELGNPHARQLLLNLN